MKKPSLTKHTLDESAMVLAMLKTGIDIGMSVTITRYDCDGEEDKGFFYIVCKLPKTATPKYKVSQMPITIYGVAIEAGCTEIACLPAWDEVLKIGEIRDVAKNILGDEEAEEIFKLADNLYDQMFNPEKFRSTPVIVTLTDDKAKLLLKVFEIIKETDVCEMFASLYNEKGVENSRYFYFVTRTNGDKKYITFKCSLHLWDEFNIPAKFAVRDRIPPMSEQLTPNDSSNKLDSVIKQAMRGGNKDSNIIWKKEKP